MGDISDDGRNESKKPCALVSLAMDKEVCSLTYEAQRDSDEREGVANNVAARESASP